MDTLLNVIHDSYAISKHVDFFRWLRDRVCEFIPHQILLAAWGDFSGGQLNYDVASNVPGVSTQVMMSSREFFDPMMKKLFDRWVSNGERWFLINRFDLAGEQALANTFLAGWRGMESALIYGVRDLRGRNDCLYVFLDDKRNFDAERSVLGILMPHIDATLRRIECLAPVPVAGAGGKRENGLPQELSGREHEIMEWVRAGKTNQEIGLILNISANTVKNHLVRIYGKLGSFSRAQAVATYSGFR